MRRREKFRDNGNYQRKDSLLQVIGGRGLSTTQDRIPLETKQKTKSGDTIRVCPSFPERKRAPINL